MQQTALITGASSGIGKALAHEHASRKRDLIVVARREDELNQLATELENKYSVVVKVIAKDLTAANACQEIYDEVQRSGVEVDYLFNNAGFGGHGKFHERALDKDLAMIDLNIKALVELTHLFLRDMVARNRGWILQTSSTAGYMPGPLQATYFATKAFVNSFSWAIREELSDTRIVVSTLNPGAVKTEFAQEADLEDTSLFADAKTPEYTARKAYAGLEANMRDIITEPSLKFFLKGPAGLVPVSTQMKLVRKMQEKE